MTIFGQDWYSAMDREYESNMTNNELGLSPSKIGTSAHPAKDALQGLKARIFQGASRVELGFTGAGKGGMERGATTPEMYGTEEREAMRNLAEVNKVELSTHATVGIEGVSGLQEGGFSDTAKEQALNEIKRAVDFAADTARGGAIVVHTGEFPRPLAEEYGDDFEMYPEEREKATMHLVDDRTGQVITSVKKDQKIMLPEFETDQWGYPDTKKPKYDEEGNPIIKEKDWGFFEQIAKAHNKKEQVRGGKDFWTPSQAIYNFTLDAKERNERAWQEEYKSRMLLYKDQLNQTNENIKRARQEGVGEDQLRQLEQKKKLEEAELEAAKEMVTARAQQLKDIEQLKGHIKPIKDYALQSSAQTMARAAMHAYDRQTYLETKKGVKFKKPLFIAPEAWRPEMYGSHPDEIKEFVQSSRDAFAQQMKKRLLTQGYKEKAAEKEAEKIASERIKATLDIGHSYMWKKYYKGDPEKFNEWILDKTEKLAKEGIIGHVHISDNMGYYDEHLTPGHGEVPIKDFVKRMKKHGLSDVIVEPAHQDFKAMLGGWSLFGSSIYASQLGPQRDSWANIEHSYFGRTPPPYFLVGEGQVPSQDFTLWSGTPLE